MGYPATKEHSHPWRIMRRRLFLIVTPDRLYLWKNAGTNPVEIPPTYEVDMPLEFAPYFESAGLDPNHIRGHAFELLVGAWLSDITRSEKRLGSLPTNVVG